MKHQEKNKKRAGIGGSNSSSSTKKSGTIWVPYHEIEESQEDPEVVAALDAFFKKSIGSPEPPLPPPQDAPDDPPPQRQQMHMAIAEWCRKVECGFRALSYRADRLHRALGQNRELALVVYCEEGDHLTCGLVNFGTVVPSTLRHAQSVRIDDANRIVYSTVAFRPFRNLDLPTTQVIVPACGVTMLSRDKSKDRTPVPDDLLRLKQMWTHCLAGGFGDMDGIQCVVCQEQTLDTKYCPLCEGSYHPKCAHVLVHVADEAPRGTRRVCRPPPRPIAGWPRPFRNGTLCNLCAYFYL